MKRIYLLIVLFVSISIPVKAAMYEDFGPVWQPVYEEYFTITDHTTNGPGNATFLLKYRDFALSHEVSFGIFSRNDHTKLEIFARQVGNSGNNFLPYPIVDVFIRNNNGNWEAGINRGYGINYIPFDDTFGFYFEEYNGQTWYSDSSMNYGGIKHVGIAYNESMADGYVFLDVTGGDSGIFDDEIIHVSDIAISTPLPSSIYLLFAGLLSSICIMRQKKE